MPSQIRPCATCGSVVAFNASGARLPATCPLSRIRGDTEFTQILGKLFSPVAQGGFLYMQSFPLFASGL